ncbi:MAG TPA: hypothetical protein VKX45_26455 [Bryobacteraceae bacterium]|nr:hypothetical protein [Bryobacteraceae bacterium]
MWFGQFALLLALLVLCCSAPGFFFLRRLRWTPLEKLCGSVGLSLILLYLAAWAIYCFGPRDERAADWIVAAAALLLGVASARDLQRLVRGRRIRQALAGQGFLIVWTLAMLFMIRLYSGAGWSADWFEHFQRSLFFLQRLPVHVTLYPTYALPARPPMENVLAAFFLGLTEDRFALFQTVFAFLNILLFLPCFLLLPRLSGKRSGPLPLVVLLAASPVVMENATYAWTKSLTAFFVLLGLALYLAGWRKRDPVRTAAAFVALAAGLLVHYSAGPYLVCLALHYLYRWFRERPLRWAELAAISVAGGLLLATWFGWSFRTYGTTVTLESNTTVKPVNGTNDATGIEKIALNLRDSVVPFWVRGVPEPFPQGDPEGTLRDQAFVFYQLNLVFAMGVAGGLVVLGFLARRLLWGRPGRKRAFWRFFVPFCVVLGIAVVGERDPNGVPHLTLLSLEALGLALLAANFRQLPQPLRFLLIAGCCADFYFGVYLQARMESMENTPRRVVYPDLQYAGGRFLTNGLGPDNLGNAAWQAWALKHRVALIGHWIEDLPRLHGDEPLFRQWWPSMEKQFRELRDFDAANCGGWGARHGGTVEYLGDLVAGPSGQGVVVAGWIFAAMFLGLIGALARQAWLAEPARPAPVKAPPRRKKRRARAAS